MVMQPTKTDFDVMIEKLVDLGDQMQMEGHNKDAKKLETAVELLTWAEEHMNSDILTCIENRHSTRKFKQDKVADELLESVVLAGRQAPSGKNKQQNHFLVIRDKDVINKLIMLVKDEFAKMEVTPENEDDIGGSITLAKKGKYDFCYNAPVLIVVANQENYGNNIADVSCAMQNMMLAANALNLGSCWINQLRWLNDNQVINDYLYSLGMREGEKVYASLAVGYADSASGLPNRKALRMQGNSVRYIG